MRDISEVKFNIKEGKIIGGHRMYYLLSDELKSVDPVHFGAVFEPHNTLFLLGLLYGFHEEFTMIDIGANIGYYSSLIAANRPKAKIYSFEPHPKVFETLQCNAKVYPNITPFQCGITDGEATEATLFCDNRNLGGHSFINSIETWGDKKGFQPEIGMYEVDSQLCNLRGFDIDFEKVKIVKIDTQGSETEILKNIYDLLPVGTIIFVERCDGLDEFAKDKLKTIFSYEIDRVFIKE